MPEEKNHNGHYTAEDFERYYSGGMTPVERHRLEKAALDDPFLADALEGYAHTPAPAADAGWLRSQLEKKLGSSKVVPVKKTGRFPLWRAAVLLVLAGGTAWAVYRYAVIPSSGNLAKAGDEASTAEAADTTAGSLSITPDTAVLHQPAPSAPLPGKVPEASRPAGNRKAKAPVAKVKTGKALKEVTAAAAPAEKATPAHPDTASLPEPVTVTAMTKTTIRQSDAEDLIHQPESTEAPASFRQGNRAAPAPAARADGRVSSKFPDGKDLAFRKKAPAAPLSERISFEGAEPAGGTAQLNYFISRNLKQPFVGDTAYRAGEVQLSFYVDGEGQATNVKIEKSFCSPCGLEAVRLLLEGPKWIPKDKSRKATVRIRF